jgi:hypothetical protein
VGRKPQIGPEENTRMLFGPGVRTTTAAKAMKAIRSDGDHASFCTRRFANTITAMPPTAVTIPASRRVPNFSKNTTLEAAEPTNGTNSAKGTTSPAG